MGGSNRTRYSTCIEGRRIEQSIPGFKRTLTTFERMTIVAPGCFGAFQFIREEKTHGLEQLVNRTPWQSTIGVDRMEVDTLVLSLLHRNNVREERCGRTRRSVIDSPSLTLASYCGQQIETFSRQTRSTNSSIQFLDDQSRKGIFPTNDTHQTSDGSGEK